MKAYVYLLLLILTGCSFSPPKRLGHLVHVTNSVSHCSENPLRSLLDPVPNSKQPSKGLTCWVVLCTVTPTSNNDLEKVYSSSKEIALVVCEF